MDFSQRNIKTWSRVGSRATFGLVALELAKMPYELVILSADTSTSAGLDRFKRTYPEKYIEVGIAEQNMVGIAAGLASEGFKVITTTFSPFQTMRCLDQIRVNLAYMQHNVCMVGLASGLVLGKLGYSHCCIEDLGIMRALPGMTVLSPADSLETAKAITAAIEHDGPTYVRLTGDTNNPMVYSSDYNYTIGTGIRLQAGTDVSIIATGTMVSIGLNAATFLKANLGLSASVLNIHTIKPLDTEIIIEEIEKTSLLVVLEEHSVIGGLGSAVAEVVASVASHTPLLSIGIQDEYGVSGSYQYLLESKGLTAEHIAKTISDRLTSLG